MIIRINGDLLEDLKATAREFDNIYVNGGFVNHVAQFYGVDTNREAQALYDQSVQEEMSRQSIIMAAKCKAWITVHLLDAHNVGMQLHDLMGMTN